MCCLHCSLSHFCQVLRPQRGGSGEALCLSEQKACIAKGYSAPCVKSREFLSLSIGSDFIFLFWLRSNIITIGSLTGSSSPFPGVTPFCSCGVLIPLYISPEPCWGNPILGKCSLEISTSAQQTTDIAKLKKENNTENLLFWKLAGLSVSEQWWIQC